MAQNQSINSEKNIFENEERFTNWQRNVVSIIHNVAQDINVFKKQFVAVQVSGVYFTRSQGFSGYCTSEITFIKFNFETGIKDILTLFPDVLRVPTGYRESLYAQLDEALGYRPDTFSNNEAIGECTMKIRRFFNGNYDPLYVLDDDMQEEVTMGLYNLYNEIGERCPWIYDLEDRGKHCTIYLLNILTSEIMNKDRSQKLSINEVASYCRDKNRNVSFSTCERHDEHGMVNQCSQAVVIKNLYSTFMLIYTVYKDSMSYIRDLVSTKYLDSLDLIVPKDEPMEVMERHNYWTNHSFEDVSLEDAAQGFGYLSIAQIRNAEIVQSGNGRGFVHENVEPNSLGILNPKKVKLPKVIS